MTVGAYSDYNMEKTTSEENVQLGNRICYNKSFTPMVKCTTSPNLSYTYSFSDDIVQ